MGRVLVELGELLLGGLVEVLGTLDLRLGALVGGAHVEQLERALGEQALELADVDLTHLGRLVGVVDAETALARFARSRS